MYFREDLRPESNTVRAAESSQKFPLSVRALEHSVKACKDFRLDENEEVMNRCMLPLLLAARLSVLSGIFLLSLYICGDITGLVQKAKAQTAPTAASQEDGQWPMPAKDYANTRYSGLADITTENVKQLKPAWTFSTGVNHGAAYAQGKSSLIAARHTGFISGARTTSTIMTG
jgi:hypothetical protein